MKNILPISLAALFILGRCNKGDDEVNYNRFSVNGMTQQITGGGMWYYGNKYSQRAETVWLELYSENKTIISLNMFVPTGQTKLAAGTYTLDEYHTQFTFPGGEVSDAEGNAFGIIGGTMQVSVSGSGDTAVYTVNVDCTITGGTVKGVYRGTLTWKDERE